jgi:hypothetical protein
MGEYLNIDKNMVATAESLHTPSENEIEETKKQKGKTSNLTKRLSKQS